MRLPFFVACVRLCRGWARYFCLAWIRFLSLVLRAPSLSLSPISSSTWGIPSDISLYFNISAACCWKQDDLIMFRNYYAADTWAAIWIALMTIGTLSPMSAYTGKILLQVHSVKSWKPYLCLMHLLWSACTSFNACFADDTCSYHITAW